MVQQVVELDTTALAVGFRGQLIGPTSDGYDSLRGAWNAAFDRRPALIARCTGVADVQAAIAFAREHDLEIAVRGGGHSIPGHSGCDGGLVVDLSAMQGVHVDPKAATARAQGGVTWGLYDRDTHAYGLASPGGQISTTGVAGLTLGGGIGWLMRHFGLVCDNLLSVDLVSADGDLVTASADEHDDLFWALRGGGGNFGIATSFEYRLQPLSTVYAGLAMYPLDQAGQLLRAFRDYGAEAPEELTTYAVCITAPPLPLVPADAVGTRVLAFAACYSGPVEGGADALRPLREAGTALVDHFEPMPYPAFQQFLDASAPFGDSYYVKGDYVRELSDGLIDALVEQASTLPQPMSELHIGHMGGAVARVPEDATAFGHRDAEYVVYSIAHWQPGMDADAHIAWGRGFGEAVEPFGDGTYVNFLGDEGPARIRFAYGAEKYDRLAEIKRRYDPDNVFHLNQNITPAA